jgi:hypothetical protein
VLIPISNHRSDDKGCNAALHCKLHCYVTKACLFVQLTPSRVCFTRTYEYAVLLLSSFNRFFFFCSLACVNFCSFAPYSGVKLVLSLLRICSCQQSFTRSTQLCKNMWYFCSVYNYISGQDLQGKSANKKFQILHLKEFVRAKWLASCLETSYLSELSLCWLSENRKLVNYLGVEQWKHINCFGLGYPGGKSDVDSWYLRNK